VPFVNLIKKRAYKKSALTKFAWVFAAIAGVSLSGCSTADMAQIREMIGLSKRTYSTKAEPVAAGQAGSASQSTPVVIAPPSGNANANAPDFVTYRIAAAKKIMAANSNATYAGRVPDPLASIPVLEISLNSDGSIAAIDVLRKPLFFPVTIELAKAAIRRAAPFGSVAHLPKPWTFNETFLFNDDLKFQLHALQP
jgi:hypothetical protein